MKIRNIIQNRKGSTLALTIIIFAVLMIFATFTLGFMVTENKQAMYYPVSYTHLTLPTKRIV